MCHQNSCPSVSIEEALPAEESLLVYCKPVELYNILLRRAQYNPAFLQRCLEYKLQTRKVRRLMDGSVIFNYKDQTDILRKSEVTREFSCPFCLTRCGGFKGLRYHLISFHDLFKFEFWRTEEYQAVNVSVRTDALQSESIADGVDPRSQSFSFCSKPRKRRRSVDPLEKAKYIHTQILEPDWSLNAPDGMHQNSQEKDEGDNAPCSSLIDNEISNSRSRDVNNSGMVGPKPRVDGSDDPSSVGLPVARAQSCEDMECMSNAYLDRRASSSMPSSSKARKLCFGSADPRSGALLQKRTFFHSHRAQPMGMEQVLSDRDSEDEVEDEVAYLEDRRMLDDFVDVSRDEKHLMHLWNSFVRRQRVIADGHVAWACEAFLRIHGQELVNNTALKCCWRLLTVKLWNHGLIDGSTINNCGSILDELSHPPQDDDDDAASDKDMQS